MISQLRFFARRIKRQLSFYGLNAVGMTMGLCAFLLINLYTYHQLSFNTSHKKYDRLVRVTSKITNAGNVTHMAISAKIAAADFKDFFPEVEEVCRINREPGMIINQDRQFEGQSTLFVDSTFTYLFTIPTLQGNPLQTLKDPNSIIITDSAAIRYFGHSEVVGETLELRNSRVNKNFKIGAIVEAPANNSSIQFDVISNFNQVSESFGPSHGHIGGINTYLLLATPNIQNINDRLETFYEDKLGQLAGIVSYELQPFHDLYFDGSLSYDQGLRGNRTAVNILIGLSVFILLLSSLNFMNLSTASAVKRHKEIAIRKVLGENRWQLILDAYRETFIIIGASLIFAIVLALSLVPWLNEFVDFDVMQALKNKSITIFSLLGLWVALAVFSGIYLAVYLSGNLSLIEKKQTADKGLKLKKILIGFQYALAGTALSGVFIVNSQLKYLESKDLGYDEGGVISCLVTMPGASNQRKETLKNRIKNISGIKNASLSLSQVNFDMPRNPFLMAGDSASNFQVLDYHAVDPDFFDTFQVPVVFGRAFRTSDSATYIVNESAAIALGYTETEQIIGERIIMGQQERSVEGEVVGIVPDFHFQSLHFDIQPLILTTLKNAQRIGFLSVSLHHGDQEVLEQIEEIWTDVFPNSNMEYLFLDELNRRQYQNEMQLSEILDYTTLIIILISSLGMLGLIQFAVDDRVQEVGIRKTLGASAYQILSQLGKPMLLLVLIGNVVAIPITWKLATIWLADFSYTPGIPTMAFVISTGISLSIAFLVIFRTLWITAHGNIVEALRYE